ncbi:MAG: c-type cytochrome biogenesis protein CcsB [Chloroflexota bacterium]|nr:c-type cytochrome biogenesis protein CcsB [Chloroflexota bacterium]
MEGLVKLSFYSFTAASIALAGAAICYLLYALGRVRVRQAQLATTAGTTMATRSTEFGLSPVGLGRFGTMLTWFAVFFQGLAILFRTLVSKSAPSNMYEFSLIFVFALALMYVLFERTYRAKQLGAVVLPVALGMAIYVWSLPVRLREVNPLIPALQNQPLMTAHVSMAIFAYASFAVSFAAAVLFLIANNRRVAWLPSPEMLDDIGYRAVTIGFPLMAGVLILGSVWAYQAWGTYWQWDPKETSALFLWLIYAVYLHTRSLRGWRGTRSAIILLIGFGAVIFTYYGNYFFGGLHAYGGV